MDISLGGRSAENARSMWKYGADKAILVTTSNFTEQAHEQAKGAPTELRNGTYLEKMMNIAWRPKNVKNAHVEKIRIRRSTEFDVGGTLYFLIGEIAVPLTHVFDATGDVFGNVGFGFAFAEEECK